MSEEIKILVFQVNNEYYATDIMDVERILGYEEITKIPNSPDFVEGVRNYADSILPIIRLSKRFNQVNIKNDEEAKIIVTKHYDTKIGIMVDVVSEVRDVKLSTVEEAPEIVSGISKKYIKGLIKFEDKIVIFLNLGAILTEKEIEELRS